MRTARTVLALVAPWILLAGCGRGPEADPRARVPVPVEGVAYDSADTDLPRLQFPDGSKTVNDRCMVLQRKLNPKIPPIYVNGTPLGFCWVPCVTAFVQGPEQRIQEQQLTFPSAVDPSRAAVIDEAHRVAVNYEIFYVADDELKQRFLSQATAFTGLLTDPVSLRRFQPDAASSRRDFAGRIFFFPDAAAPATFDADPNRFAFPVYKMM